MTADVSEDILNSDSWDRGLQDGTGSTTELSLPWAWEWVVEPKRYAQPFGPETKELSLVFSFSLSFFLSCISWWHLPHTLLQKLHELDSAAALCTRDKDLILLFWTYHSTGKFSCLSHFLQCRLFFLSLPCSKAFSRVGDVVLAYVQKALCLIFNIT